jgi:ankyrin repeat protein
MSKKLFDAIERNDTVETLLLIKKTKEISGKYLNFATHRGRLDVMQVLLDAGVDIDAVYDRESAVVCAIRNGRLEALKLLIARGANVSAIRPTENSLLRIAITCLSYIKDDQIPIVLLDAGAPLDNLTPHDLINLVACWCSVGVLTRLMARNVNVSLLLGSSGGSMCHTVVEMCALNGNGERIGALLQALVNVAGVDVNAIDFFRKSALHYAAILHNATALRFLVELGANVNLKCREGRSALHALFDNEHAIEDPCTAVLLALGADARLVDRSGETACHAAGRRTQPIALAYLAAMGGDLDQANFRSETPRQLALDRHCPCPIAAEVGWCLPRIERTRLDFVRYRACQIGVGLQSLRLDALQLCEIMRHSFGALGSLIAFHHWWKIATTIKHFHTNKRVKAKVSQALAVE